jgi:hypothetical protein
VSSSKSAFTLYPKPVKSYSRLYVTLVGRVRDG